MSRGVDSYRPAIMGVTHAVSAGHYLAAAAGYRILEEGGNAVDAGVASGIAINVTLPNAATFGGVAPIVIYEAKSDSVVTISGLGRWPRAASIDYFNRHAGGEIPLGILRCVTPGAPDAWLTALQQYGTMTFEQVVTPALELAEKGFPISATVQSTMGTSDETALGSLGMWPSTADVFMPKGRRPEVGEPVVQSDLARTFKRMIEAERGGASGGREAGIRAARDLFYKGEIAEEMARFSAEQGGLLTLDDLKEFSVKVEPPEVGRFREYEVYTCGPWCQGPVVAQTLQMLADDDLAGLGHNSADYAHLVSQALNLSFADRHRYYGDPDHVDVPMGGLLSAGYTRERRQAVDMARAFGEMPEAGNPWPYQGRPDKGGEPTAPLAAAPGRTEQDTSYTCVVDRWGNGFSATPSDGIDGAPIVPGLGFPISSRGSQNWLDPEQASSLQPWKRPRLTPNPSIVLRNGKLFMPFGTPGGDAQCSAMVQLFLNVVEHGMNPQLAIEQPRFIPWNFPNSFWPHTYLPGRLTVEGRVPDDTVAGLAARGHDVAVLDDWSPSMGAMSAIVVDQEAGTLHAGADPRRDTYAIGR